MKRNVAGQAWRFSLFKGNDRVDNPTLAAGDFKVDIDGGGQANVTTLPTSDGAGLVTWQPTQEETDGQLVEFLCKDAAGDEWDPVTFVFVTEAETIIATKLDKAISDLNDLSAAQVWTYATRTLTQTVASITAAVCGSELSIRRGDTVVISLTGLTIPADWTRCWFAVKNDAKNDADTASLLYVVESNPGAGTDGLIYLNGAAASSATDAEITVNQPAGTITITLGAAATAQLTPRAKRSADLQVLSTSGGVQTLTEWPELVTVEADVVRATS